MNRQKRWVRCLRRQSDLTQAPVLQIQFIRINPLTLPLRVRADKNESLLRRRNARDRNGDNKRKKEMHDRIQPQNASSLKSFSHVTLASRFERAFARASGL